MVEENLIRRDEDTGYIIAWKMKYEFETGKMDELMTYGEARKKCSELNAENEEKTFWPEKKKQVSKLLSLQSVAFFIFK